MSQLSSPGRAEFHCGCKEHLYWMANSRLSDDVEGLMSNKLFNPAVFKSAVIQVVLAISLAVTAALPYWGTALATYPPAGVDEFDSAATVTIDLTVSIGQVLKVSGAGPTRVERGAPYNPGDSRLAIDTEIVALELHGLSALGPVT